MGTQDAGKRNWRKDNGVIKASITFNFYLRQLFSISRPPCLFSLLMMKVKGKQSFLRFPSSHIICNLGCRCRYKLMRPVQDTKLLLLLFFFVNFSTLTNGYITQLICNSILIVNTQSSQLSIARKFYQSYSLHLQGFAFLSIYWSC